jgi:hypothetical protein
MPELEKKMDKTQIFDFSAQSLTHRVSFIENNAERFYPMRGLTIKEEE